MEKKKNTNTKKLLKSDFLSGEGISDIEEKRIQNKKKQQIDISITSEEREDICKQLGQTVIFSIELMDILYFILLQFLPLLVLGLGMLVPSIYYIKLVSVNIRNVLIILIILGSMVLFYALVRFLATVSYKIEISNTTIKWRNFFIWLTIENKNCEKVSPIGSYYFYLPKIKGVIQFGFEVIKIISKEKTYWIRAYPFRKKKSRELIKYINCWLDLSV